MPFTILLCAVLAISSLNVFAGSVQTVNVNAKPSPSSTKCRHSQITAPPLNPHYDLKRQAASLGFNSSMKTCGWVNNMADWPLTCYASQQCLSQADYFACCESPQTTYTTLQSQAVTSFQECYYWKGCYDSTASVSCTNAACSSTAFVCSSAVMPYCGTAIWTYPWAGSSYVGSYFFCHSQRYTLSASFGSAVPKVAPSTSIQTGTTQVSGAARFTNTPSNMVVASTSGTSSTIASTPSSDASGCLIGSQVLIYGLPLVLASLTCIWRQSK